MLIPDTAQPNLSQPEVDARFADIERQNLDVAGLTDEAFTAASMHPENVVQQPVDRFDNRFGTGFLKKLDLRPGQTQAAAAPGEIVADEVQQPESPEEATIHTIEQLSPEKQANAIAAMTIYMALLHRQGYTVR